MQVKLNKIFPLDGSVDDAWQILKDIEAVAGCMPGAEITEAVDENNFKGNVKVKVGPMHVAFSGDIEVQGIDAGERRIHLIASGQDNKGTSSASMDLTARLRESGPGATELTGDAGVTVNGKLANFGGRMMTQVSDQILGQFADNFREKLAAVAPAGGSGEPAAEAPVAPPEVREINGLRLAWDALIGWIKSFFTGKK